MEKETQKQKYIRVHKAALRLDCLPRRIYSLIQIGELEGIRLGIRGIRVSEASIDEYIKRKKIDPNDIYSDKSVSL